MDNYIKEHKKTIATMALVRLARESGWKVKGYVEDKTTGTMREIYKIPAD